ncbi:MAG: hypothetical protein G8345_21480 [Magnetococcales bacterium]|nr:hypothetical protein [Magnetococcales bacterium]NGZ29446.1 hypothetical protein [Magnetococcales bacterium]
MAIDSQEADEIANVRKEVQELRENLIAMLQRMRETDQANNEKFENLRSALHSANETITKYSRNLTFIEKRMDGMRTDTSTGLVLSVLIFTLLFLISLFMRS